MIREKSQSGTVFSLSVNSQRLQFKSSLVLWFLNKAEAKKKDPDLSKQNVCLWKISSNPCCEAQNKNPRSAFQRMQGPYFHHVKGFYGISALWYVSAPLPLSCSIHSGCTYWRELTYLTDKVKAHVLEGYHLRIPLKCLLSCGCTMVAAVHLKFRHTCSRLKRQLCVRLYRVLKKNKSYNPLLRLKCSLNV